MAVADASGLASYTASSLTCIMEQVALMDDILKVVLTVILYKL